MNYMNRILSLNYSGTSVLIVNVFQNSWHVLRLTSTERWSIFSCGVVLWLTQVLGSVTSPEQAPSVQTLFFLSKCDEYRVSTSSEANEYLSMTTCVSALTGWLGWSLGPYTKRLQVDSWSRYIPRLRVQALVRAHTGGNLSVFLSHWCFSLKSINISLGVY